MIRGELVNLRAVERADATHLTRWFNDPDLMRFWGIPDSTVSSNEVQHRIEVWLEEEVRLGRPSCLIVDTLDSDSVGLVILSDYQPNHRSTSLSLMIGDRARWGEGLGGDALRTIVDTCFDSWNLHRVWLRVETHNDRAQRLYRRYGFTLEATLRDATFLDGTFHDVLVFGRLASDPLSGNDT